MADQSQNLWRDRDFLRLWLGETVSQFGSQITTLALPLTAVLILGATPAQIGALGAAQFAPFFILALFAGVWVDRRRRRPVMVGAALAPALQRRVGLGRALILTYLLGCFAPLLIPLADGPRPFLIATLLAGFALLNGGSAGSQVFVWSLRQSLVPPEALGRMNAAYRFFVTGMVPLGALLGGVLGGAIGLRPTLLIAALGSTLALGWVLASSLPQLRELPGAEGTPATKIATEVA